jgi:uncharacterized protein
MNLYFDTSALIKKYIDEKGSDKVDELFNNAENIFVSNITEIETLSTFKRLQIENEITEKEYQQLKKEIEIDFHSFEIIELDDEVINYSKKVIEKYQLKSLDSIQLGSLLVIKNMLDHFIVCDKKLLEAGKKEKINIINPNEK